MAYLDVLQLTAGWFEIPYFVQQELYFVRTV